MQLIKLFNSSFFMGANIVIYESYFKIIVFSNHHYFL